MIQTECVPPKKSPSHLLSCQTNPILKYSSCEYHAFFVSDYDPSFPPHYSLPVVNPRPHQKKRFSRPVHIWHRLGSLWSCNDLPVTITLSCDDREVCTCPAERELQPGTFLLRPPANQRQLTHLSRADTHASFTNIQTHKWLLLSPCTNTHTAWHCLSFKTSLISLLSLSLIPSSSCINKTS